ncbi:MAG: protein-methionine-sulfoxide reductase catalytic subunit MsrP [Brevefilum sp.]
MNKNRYRSVPLQPDEVTPQELYRTRRRFLKQMGITGLGALLAACAPRDFADVPIPEDIPTNGRTDERGNTLTSYQAIASYCNFYEFTTNKERVDELAQDFVTDPWSVTVNGLVNNPRTYSLKEIQEKFVQEERIYRMRCVEGWSMVIPWLGFPLRQLLEEVQPTGEAQFVAFETALVPEQMDSATSGRFPFPYLEGLRLDEAMHELTLLATGLYGEALPPQNGAPIRLVVPWKYGFKSIKTIVRISLVAEQPPTLWNTIAPQEYGFYANVNPEVDHPRWSQATERRIGESGRRETLFMNGYAEEVLPLYEGMDLEIFF